MTRDQEQVSGADSLQNQAQRDVNQSITNNTYNSYYGVSERDARAIALDVYDQQLPALTASARARWASDCEEMTERIISGVLARDPSRLESFREPRLQVALGQAQRGYALSGDGSSTLRDVLARLVVETASETARSHRDLIVRQAIEVAPKLTGEQSNALAILVQLNFTHFPRAKSPLDLLNKLERNYADVYEGKLPDHAEEYSYMASVGCGVVSQFTPELLGQETTPVLEHLHRTHDAIMFSEFLPEELPSDAGIGAIGHLVLPSVALGCEGIPDFESTVRQYCADPEFIQRVASHDDRPSLSETEKSFAKFLTRRVVDHGKLKAVAALKFPRLKGVFDQLDRTRASHFQLSAVGRVLGCQTAMNLMPHDASLYEQIFSEVSGGAQQSAP
ncbi:hypothetical protein HQ602_17300 [Rhodococcus kroppenstedtii]|uniref:LPO_1073/Vpar_1526 family protein n=1 Tax=Rhodococcoides kroppenstedtii TaxID=293050 RepID=UPI001C9A5FCE|nr:LPO_1073/Vpar_1526 family protein [Rhodococcus kroppenstedtii]MBY6438133.1 hypothetical protein [Rhodococcus kroppenstedtii]